MSPLKRFNKVAPTTPTEAASTRKLDNTPLQSSSASLLDDKAQVPTKERPGSAPVKVDKQDATNGDGREVKGR